MFSLGEFGDRLTEMLYGKPDPCVEDIPRNLRGVYCLYEIELGSGVLRVGMVRGKTGSSKFEHYFEDAISRLIDIGGYDILLAPEYSFLSSPFFTSGRKDEIMEKFAGLSSGKDMLLIPGTIVWQDENTSGDKSYNGVLRNTSPIIYDGKVLEYDKRDDGGEQNMANAFELRAEFGKESGLFEWRGYRCGIEICADHDRLRKDDINDLDLQFLIACGATPGEKNMVVREGGYFLYCDGDKPEADVKRRVGGKMKSVKPRYIPK